MYIVFQCHKKKIGLGPSKAEGLYNAGIKAIEGGLHSLHQVIYNPQPDDHLRLEAVNRLVWSFYNYPDYRTLLLSSPYWTIGQQIGAATACNASDGGARTCNL